MSDIDKWKLHQSLRKKARKKDKIAAKEIVHLFNGIVHVDASFPFLSSDNPFFSAIDAMPDIRPRKKSIPLVSELVSKYSTSFYMIIFLTNNGIIWQTTKIL